MPHRVAVNASVVGARPSGLGHYAIQLIRELDRIHPDLTVYTSAPAAMPGLRAVLWSSPTLARPERGLLGHAARLIWCQTALRARLRRCAPSALLNTLPEGILRSRVPQVTVVHDLIPLAFPDAFPRQQWYFRWVVPAVLRESRAVVAISEATRRAVIAAYGLPPTRVTTVPCGFDADRFRPDGLAAGQAEAPYLLYVGNVLPHKNLPRLLEAFGHVAVPARLVLIASGHPHRVKSLTAEARRIGPKVAIRPYVPSAELAAWYRGARALVLPSLAEGFGLPALEAMACGTPVIAANVSSLPEVVGQAGLLVDPSDREALTRAMRQILLDDDLHGELRARGLEQAAKFSWSAAARAVRDVLDGVTG